MFDIEKITTSTTAWGQVALDRCSGLARSAWSGLRASRLPAEAAIGIAASPGGYDAILEGSTTATRIAARGIAWAARAVHQAATAAATAVVVAVARVHLPSGLAAAKAVAAAEVRITDLGTQVAARTTQVAGRVSDAAASPAVRQATVTAASVARTVVTVDRVTSGALIAWVAGRGSTAGRIARTATNPWTLLGGVIGTFVVSTGVAALRASAHTAQPASAASTGQSSRPAPLTPVKATPVMKANGGKPGTARPKARKAA